MEIEEAYKDFQKNNLQNTFSFTSRKSKMKFTITFQTDGKHFQTDANGKRTELTRTDKASGLY